MSLCNTNGNGSPEPQRSPLCAEAPEAGRESNTPKRCSGTARAKEATLGLLAHAALVRHCSTVQLFVVFVQISSSQPNP